MDPSSAAYTFYSQVLNDVVDGARRESALRDDVLKKFADVRFACRTRSLLETVLRYFLITRSFADMLCLLALVLTCFLALISL